MHISEYNIYSVYSVGILRGIQKRLDRKSKPRILFAAIRSGALDGS